MSIVVIAEQENGNLRKIAREVGSEAVRLAGVLGAPAIGLTVGPGAEAAAATLGDLGIERAIALEGTAVDVYSGEAYAKAIADAIPDLGAKVVLMGASSLARDLLGRMGAHLSVAPAADCTEVRVDSGTVRVVRPVFAGKALLELDPGDTLLLASLRANTFAAETGKAASCAVEKREVEDGPERCARLVETRRSETAGRPDLQDAEVVVAGGRGLQDPETFTRLIEPFADTLGAAIGASRAVVDAGWRPHSEQVGQTGKVVSPKLYFACGISGMIQHLAGMRTSRTIVAVNKDPNAPIFKVADYGIVGDVEEVLPALMEQAKSLQ